MGKGFLYALVCQFLRPFAAKVATFRRAFIDRANMTCTIRSVNYSSRVNSLNLSTRKLYSMINAATGVNF